MAGLKNQLIGREEIWAEHWQKIKAGPGFLSYYRLSVFGKGPANEVSFSGGDH